MTPTGLTVLHILAPGEIGGLERVVHGLVTGLAESGHRPIVAAVLPPSSGAHPFLNLLSEHGIAVRPVVVPDRGYRLERRAVAELCRRESPAVVHTHGFRPDVIDAGIARRQDIATVTTVHGFTGGSWRVRLYEHLQIRALRRFSAVVAVSRPLLARLTLGGVPTGQVHCIPNAWHPTAPPLPRDEARARLGLPVGGFVVGWVGRLSAEKGTDVAVAALSHLRDLPITLAIVGTGPNEPSLRASARQAGVEGRVHWAGSVGDAGMVFSAFDMFLLSSRSEGTPIVLFEALATGTPLVVTRVGGVPDVVTDREAILVPPEAPAEIADAIREIHMDPAEAYQRAERGRKRLTDEFAFGPWIEKYVALYHTVIPSHPRG